jgi:CSLREA domain-containing protein
MMLLLQAIAGILRVLWAMVGCVGSQGRPPLRSPALIVVLIALGAAASPAGAATVTKTADSDDGLCDADCSLREAIAVAAPGETVTVPASGAPFEVTDGLGTLVIDKSLTVAGAGARLTEVTAPGTTERPFTVVAPVGAFPTVTIRDLSITGGDGNGDGHIGQGGGVLAVPEFGGMGAPQLTLDRVRIANNTASLAGDFNATGGGVKSQGPGTHVIIRDSLVSGNQAVGTANAQATGGGLVTFSAGTMAIENTTIVDNQALSDRTTGLSAIGGGASVGATSSLLNVTLAANSAQKTSMAALDGRGGNIFFGANTVTVRNTIVTAGVADNTAEADCSLAFNTQGGNVLPPGCGPGGGDRAAADALLGPLADHGGQTDTLALLTGSPALDAGTGCPPPATDQRGVSRPQGSACDSGAFEVEVPSPSSPTAPNCQGRTATIVGTDGAETLKGTPNADVIASLGGNDKVSALAGNDRVCAGAGKDKVSGGKGTDRLNGEGGKDRLAGGGGNDRLKGGKGGDTLIGGAGKDKLAGGAGRDTQLQ